MAWSMGALFLRKPNIQPKFDDVPWADQAEHLLIEQGIRQRLGRLQSEDEPLLRQIEEWKQQARRQADLVKGFQRGRVMRLMLATQEFWRRVQGKTIL